MCETYKFKVGDIVEVIGGTPYYYTTPGSWGVITSVGYENHNVNFNFHTLKNNPGQTLFCIDKYWLRLLSEAPPPLPDVPYAAIINKIKKMDKAWKTQQTAKEATKNPLDIPF